MVQAKVAPRWGCVESDINDPMLTPWATDLLPLRGSSLFYRNGKIEPLRRHSN
jgi:hypothetical protein